MKSSRFNKLTSIQRRLLLAALCFGLVPTTWAQELDSDWAFAKPRRETQRFGISPFYGYRFGGEVEDGDTGKEYSFDDTPAFGLFLDYAPTDYPGRFELLWSHQDTSIDFEGNYGLGEVDVTIDIFQFGGVVEYGSDRFRQYVSAHVGATHISTDDYGDDTKFSFGIGGGVKAFLTKNIYLRADVRGFCTVVESESSFIYVNGVTVARFSGDTIWQGQASVGFGITF